MRHTFSLDHKVFLRGKPDGVATTAPDSLALSLSWDRPLTNPEIAQDGNYIEPDIRNKFCDIRVLGDESEKNLAVVINHTIPEERLYEFVEILLAHIEPER